MLPKLHQHGVKEVLFFMLGSKMVSDMVCKLLLMLDGFGIQKIVAFGIQNDPTLGVHEEPVQNGV